LKKTVRWFGDLALNKMKGKYKKERRVLECPKCKAPLHEYVFDEEKGDFVDNGVFEFTVRRRVYYRAIYDGCVYHRMADGRVEIYKVKHG